MTSTLRFHVINLENLGVGWYNSQKYTYKKYTYKNTLSKIITPQIFLLEILIKVQILNALRTTAKDQCNGHNGNGPAS